LQNRVILNKNNWCDFRKLQAPEQFSPSSWNLWQTTVLTVSVGLKCYEASKDFETPALFWLPKLTSIRPGLFCLVRKSYVGVWPINSTFIAVVSNAHYQRNKWETKTAMTLRVIFGQSVARFPDRMAPYRCEAAGRESSGWAKPGAAHLHWW